MIQTPKMPVKIMGTGFFVPERIVTNQEYEQVYGIPAAWIEQVTGVKTRRVCAPQEACSDLAVKAAQMALTNAQLDPQAIDLVILASVGPDYSSPPTSTIIQNRIGAVNAASFDVDVACMGFIWAVNLAAALIASGLHRTILVVASEPATRAANYQDKETFILLGDGAGALIMTGTKEPRGILSSYLKSDGSRWETATILGGGSRYPDYYKDPDIGKYFFAMKGRDIFKFAVKAMNEAISAVLQETGISKEDLKLVIPHQANYRILQAAIKRSGISADKFVINVDRFGNTSAASIALALAEADQLGRVARDDLVLLVGFGAGLNWGATLIRW
jgi:3-oxoacyl-[acyl-carrier-protein] synthase III